MMRKTVFHLIIFMTALMVASCSGSRGYRIGVSQCSEGNWRSKLNNEMLAAQYLFDETVDVSIVNCHDNSKVQVRQIDSLASSGIDLLVVAPNEYSEIAPAIDRARQKGIPVIFFDRKTDSDLQTAFIGGDNVAVGRMAAEYALQLARQVTGRKAVVTEIAALQNTSPARDRHHGFEQVMRGHAGVDYVSIMSDWSDRRTERIVREQLAGPRCPDIIFCHSDFMAAGAWRAVKAAHREGQVSIIGVDGLPGPGEGIEMVQKGMLAGTCVYPTQGEEIIRLALKILKGESYERENYLQGMLITPDNVRTVALYSDELKEQGEDLIKVRDRLEDYFGLYSTQRKVLLASLVSILLLIAGLLMTWRAAKQIRQAHRRQKQLNEEQTRFYTNASHQLKTPLTLIAGPVRQLLGSGSLKGDELGLLEVVSRNVEQLERVTENVLNFRSKDVDSAAIDDTNVASTHDTSAIQEARLAVMKQEDTDELPSILVVDDNADIRYYLRTLLSDRFYVLEAADGQLGLKIAREMVPDIVVSDVMMPVMNGLELCRRLKEDSVTSHIPVILLTARDTEAQQMEGYEHGADAYLTKPFSADLLISRIYNLVRSRQQLRELFTIERDNHQQSAPSAPSASQTAQSPQPPHPSQDQLFAENVKEAILKHMGNPSLKMDELGEEIGLSRVQLYRKVKALTGLSPVELLRQMRLQRGYTLLTTTTKTVNEVAYEVGFGTPGYFSKCFKQQFGKYPTEVRGEK